jgi:primosomal replication protein N
MSERPKVRANWDIQTAATTLQGTAEAGRHVIFGDGVRIDYASGKAVLDLYPQTLVARYRGGTTRLDVAKVVALEVSPPLVKVRALNGQAETEMLLDASGGLALHVLPIVELEQRRSTPLPEVTAPQRELLAAAAPENGKDPETKNRVEYTGRVGKDPVTRVTPKGVVIAQIPLAVHQGEKTEWHKVLFFNERAKKAQEELQKGQMLTVIGYTHTRTFTGRDGRERQVTEIFATAAHPPKS